MERLHSNGQMIDQIDLRGVPHSGFDRSNHNYGSGKLGTLIPCRLDEVYPGDRIKGKPQIVENFEPLAAPLMGTLLLKQESFFVPYILLWRHAWKFFTGKNGFCEEMPTVTPLRIFQVWCEYLHNDVWLNIGDLNEWSGFNRILNTLRTLYQSSTNKTYEECNELEYSLYRDFQAMYTEIYTALPANFASRKMIDLLLPIFQNIKRYGDSAELSEISIQLGSENVSKQTKETLILQLINALSELVRRFFEYLHGPSSLCDYLGWPVVYETHGDYKIKGINDNIFAFAMWRHVVSTSPLNLQDKIESYFSQVPLVFNSFKAYYLIWYWNYRDQLLETDILDPEEDEFLSSTISDNVILYCTINRQRCWLKDTFTTALTNTGDGNLLVPTLSDIDGTIDFKYYNNDGQLINTKDHADAIRSGATVASYDSNGISYQIPMNYLRSTFSESDSSEGTNDFISLDLFDRIRRLRNVIMKRSILGYEVDDVVYSSFLVKMSNVRMHIPEILSRGRDIVQMNTVVNNTSTAQQIAGDKTATAWCNSVGSEMNYFSEDWGLFLTIKTTMPIQSYAGGMQRLYLKTHNLDYMWPEFSAMGMDAIYNTELAALGTHLTDQQGLMVFGYQGRYYDLKSRQDEVHGRLLTDLNYLTFSREFDKDNPPKLNYIFVHCWPRLDGFVINDRLEDLFRYDCYNESNWERRLPVPSEFV